MPSASECGAEHLVAAPADDHERVTGAVGIDGYEVVAERPVETGRRQGDFSTSICLFRLTVFGRHLSPGTGVYGVDESLHVHIEYFRRLGLGADVGQI